MDNQKRFDPTVNPANGPDALPAAGLTPALRADLLDQLETVYEAAAYPKGFTDAYVIMECLAERNGIDTFLVQRLRALPVSPIRRAAPLQEPQELCSVAVLQLAETGMSSEASVHDDASSDRSAESGLRAGQAGQAEPAKPAADTAAGLTDAAGSGAGQAEPAKPAADTAAGLADAAGSGAGQAAPAEPAQPRFIAKCYDREVWTIESPEAILQDLDHASLPKLIDSFENDAMIVTVREYIEGVSLDQFVLDNPLTEQDVVRICTQLCDILTLLHRRPDPIIHRDIKPQNVIVRPDGGISLIDFDIARTWRPGNDTDTRFFGTIAYAPPEQYGFSQTDARADIYSLGVLLRYLLTGSTRENRMIRVYKPLQKVIDKCTAFAPDQRFADAEAVKKALLAANPAAQKKRIALTSLSVLAVAVILALTGHAIYEKVTYDPFNDEAIPAFTSDADRIADAVSYMRETYHTDLFDDADDLGDYGWFRQVLMECYGLDHDYVYAYNEDMPQESDEFFLPWSYPDEQLVDRDEMVYFAVKLGDPSIVADWSSLSDDNGEYPGARVALAFAEKTGIMTGVNKPDDLSRGEVALILANADRVFKAAEETLQKAE